MEDCKVGSCDKDGTCSLGNNNRPCRVKEDCSEPLICSDYSKTCQQNKLIPKEPCSEAGDCESGTYCNKDTGTCIARKGAREFCIAHSDYTECIDGYDCFGATSKCLPICIPEITKCSPGSYCKKMDLPNGNGLCLEIANSSSLLINLIGLSAACLIIVAVISVVLWKKSCTRDDNELGNSSGRRSYF